MWGNDELFAAPADGVITTQGRFDPEEDLIDVKGANISVNSVLTHRFAIDTPALVSCIFMTAADVHWNRSRRMLSWAAKRWSCPHGQPADALDRRGAVRRRTDPQGHVRLHDGQYAGRQ